MQKMEKKSAARKKWKKKIGCNKMKKLVTEPVLVRASVVGIAGRLGARVLNINQYPGC
jgi:hypothetical protein